MCSEDTYVRVCGSERLAAEFQNAQLTKPKLSLPRSAQDVLDGKGATSDYWAWLIIELYAARIDSVFKCAASDHETLSQEHMRRVHSDGSECEDGCDKSLATTQDDEGLTSGVRVLLTAVCAGLAWADCMGGSWSARALLRVIESVRGV